VGKKYKSALAIFDLGQSANGANPNGREKEQPLKQQGTADAILPNGEQRSLRSETNEAVLWL
jgi:hypothetical protein